MLSTRRALLCVVAFALTADAPADAAQLKGRVQTGNAPAANARVTLFASGEDGAARLGTATTNRRGRFTIRYRRRAGAVHYAIARKSTATQLMAIAGGRRVTVNELSTVASAYALSRFLDGTAVTGPAISLTNAAGTARNLVRPRRGTPAPAITSDPNGTATSSLATFRTLAAITAGCTQGTRRTCDRLLAAATPPGGSRPATTLAAIHSIALHPTNHVARIFRLPKSRAYRPILAGPPDAWVLSLKHSGALYDGPGRMAFDSKGNIWVTNNFQPPGTDAGSYVIALDPTGRPRTEAPFDRGTLSGGGVLGNWWGIAVDLQDRVWLSNYTGDDPNEFYSPAFTGGIAASLFTSDGTALSPATGITAGPLQAPQGIAVDQDGDVFIANHGNETVVRYPGGDTSAPQVFSGHGIYNPFTIAIDGEGNAWVDNGSLDVNATGSVTRIAPDGTVTGPFTAPSMRSPQGMAVDSAGDLWIAGLADSTVTWMAPDGTVKGQFTAPSMDGSWGIAIDGDDNVWVASFFGETITQLCGRDPSNCPPGSETGDAISPANRGFGNGGLQHLTAVQVDASGNVWVANNWARLAPTVGGDGLVQLIGAAAPVRTPIMGLPAPPG